MLKYYRNLSDLVTVLCSVYGIFPAPELSLWVNDYRLENGSVNEIPATGDGLFDSSISIQLVLYESLQADDVIKCVLTIPGTEYRRTKETVFVGEFRVWGTLEGARMVLRFYYYFFPPGAQTPPAATRGYSRNRTPYWIHSEWFRRPAERRYWGHHHRRYYQRAARYQRRQRPRRASSGQQVLWWWPLHRMPLRGNHHQARWPRPYRPSYGSGQRLAPRASSPSSSRTRWTRTR